MADGELTPAVKAAIAAQKRVNLCLDENRNFRLEAGAGAGKTYSLVEALKRLIKEQGAAMMQTGKRVACITFTDNAREEIAREIEMHPAILVDTIHGFAWAFISKFQKSLRDLVAATEERQGAIADASGMHFAGTRNALRSSRATIIFLLKCPSNMR